MVSVAYDDGGRQQIAMHEAIALAAPGQCESALRENYKHSLKVAAQVAELEAAIASINAQIDEAVQRDHEATAAIRAELDNPDTTSARRIAARVELDRATVALEAEIAELQKSKRAAARELKVLRPIAGARQVIANAFANAGPPAEQDRIKVLRKTIELVGQVQFAARRKSEDAENALAWAQADKEKHPSRYGSLEDWERQARIAGDVDGLISGFVRQCNLEMEAIRQKRIAMLHNED